MVSVKSVLMPFRMSLKDKKPITLRVELVNDEKETKLLSFKLAVAGDLSVEKTTIANVIEKRLGEFAPGQQKLMYFEIYPKVATRAREYPARLTIYEHYNDYEFVNREYKKDFVVKVSD